MIQLTWSAHEKKTARAAFDLALARELEATKRQVEAMLRSPDPQQIWNVHDYLSEKRREIDTKYDYRYSVLMTVFGRLLSEKWLTESDLAGLGTEKLSILKRIASIY